MVLAASGCIREASIFMPTTSSASIMYLGTRLPPCMVLQLAISVQDACGCCVPNSPAYLSTLKRKDKPVALSIVQARLVGLAHFSIGYVLTYGPFVIASSGKEGCSLYLPRGIHSSAAHELPVVRDSDPCAFRDLLSV